MNVARIDQTDTESDTAVKTTVDVFEYCGALITRLHTPRDYLMNTDTALFSFPTFLGLLQLTQCKKDDLISPPSS